MKKFTFILSLSLLTITSFANSSATKKPLNMVSAEISIAIESHDQCVSYFEGAAILYSCAYELGFNIPDFGKIEKAEVIGKKYFETDFSISETKLIVTFTYAPWIDDADLTKEDLDNFALEVAEYLKTNKTNYKFIYSGPDIEIDHSIVGQPAALK